MAIYTVSQTSGFSIPSNNETDIVAAGVTISDTGANDVVHGNAGSANSQLINFGSILGTDGTHSGVDFEGFAGTIFNAASASIAGNTGVALGGDDESLTNNGTINGINTGVTLGPASDDAYVLNHGYIRGGAYGITAASDTDGALIVNTGTIDCDGTAIVVNTALGALTTEITNTGIIRGAVHAINALVGAFSLVNEGTLVGDVVGASLASTGDSIVNSGQIKGNVHLGAGNDTFNGGGGTSGTIFGDAGVDRVTGGSAGDKMDGGLDNDTLIGGAGADHFVFSTALAANIDHIVDFKHAVDKFELDHSVFAAVGAVGTLTGAAFFKGAHAHDSNDRIIYNPLNGFVYYDSNGSGAGHEVHFATLAHGLALSHADFLIV